MDNLQKNYDVAVIGAGPGGYTAAIRGAQLGMKVICIDASPLPGGTCLNIGCIPSKVMLQSTYKYYDALHNFDTHGINLGPISFDLAKMMTRKDGVVSGLGRGITGLFKKNKVDYINGHAAFTSESHDGLFALQCHLHQDQTEQLIYAQKVIIATGSSPVQLPGYPFDGHHIISSTEALTLPRIPEKLVIIGGGAIGLEMGSVWSRLGSEVTFLEKGDHVLGHADEDVATAAQLILQKQGLRFISGVSLGAVEHQPNGKIDIHYHPTNTPADRSTLSNTDHLLVAIGRQAHTINLGLDRIGLETNSHGQITVDQDFSTAVPGVYAIGDVIGGMMLAHKASEEGVTVVEMLAGHKPKLNYNAIPAVIYTHPEIATVGFNEKQLQEKAIEYKVGKFPFTANSRGRATGNTEGYVKVIAGKDSDQILGAAIIGEGAGELIQNLVTAIEFRAASEDMGMLFYGHPGTSEAIKEACLAIFSKPLHL